jgi:hypothetical protein
MSGLITCRLARVFTVTVTSVVGGVTAGFTVKAVFCAETASTIPSKTIRAAVISKRNKGERFRIG